MAGPKTPHFRGGTDIAMKLPLHHYQKTVSFYKDVLRLPLLTENDTGCSFEFGKIHLHLDLVPSLSQAEVWLEVATDDTTLAAEYLSAQRVTRRDEVEPLPEGFDGFWVCNPADIIHLVVDEKME